jgi:hypothetical protein
MQLNKKRAAAIAGATTIALTSAGVAFAFWTSSGGGTGTAGTSSGVTTIAVSGDDQVNDLAPGVAPEAITATISNPTNQNAQVTNLKVEIASIDSGANSCDAGSYSLSATDPGAALTGTATSGTSNINIPVGVELTPNDSAAGGTDQTTETFYLGFVDAATNQDGCKGATVHLTYTAS